MKKRALITGASSGIGLAFSKLLARDGYDVVLVARSQRRLQQISKDLENSFSIQAYVLEQDLSKEGAVKSIYDHLQRKKMSIDVLVNNAGFGLFGEFSRTDWKKESAMIQLNIVTLTEMSKFFLPSMLRNRSGKIVNVASTASFMPGPLMAVYYATKAYVLSFSEALAKEVEGMGVSVTALCPGPTATGFQKASELEESKLIKGKTFPDAQEVARYGYQAMKDGKVVAVHGIANQLIVWFVRLMPRSIITSMVYKFQQIDKG